MTMGKTKHLAPWWSVDAQIDGPRAPGVDPDERGPAPGVGSLPIRLAAKGIVRAVRMGAQEERHQAMASVSPILVDRLLAISRALAGHVDPGAAFRATAVEIETLIPHAHMDVAVLLDEGRSHACYEAGFHTSWSDLAEHPLPTDLSPVRMVFRGEVPYLLTGDALTDQRFHFAGALDEPIYTGQLRSRIIVPMRARRHRRHAQYQPARDRPLQRVRRRRRPAMRRFHRALHLRADPERRSAARHARREQCAQPRGIAEGGCLEADRGDGTGAASNGHGSARPDAGGSCAGRAAGLVVAKSRRGPGRATRRARRR